MKRFLLSLALFIGPTVFGYQTANAQACQWNYTLNAGQSTATYCGDVVVNGALTAPNADIITSATTFTTSPHPVNEFDKGTSGYSSFTIQNVDTSLFPPVSGTLADRSTMWIAADRFASNGGGFAEGTYGLEVAAFKDNWLGNATTIPGQFGGIVIAGGSGGPATGPNCGSASVGCGDLSAIQANMVQASPNSVVEYSEFKVGYEPSSPNDPTVTGSILMHGFIGEIRQDQGTAIGFLLSCDNGTCSNGFEVRNKSTGVTNPGSFSTAAFEYLYDNGTDPAFPAWMILPNGTECLSGPGAAATNTKCLTVAGNNLEVLNAGRTAVIDVLDNTGNLYVGGTPNSATPVNASIVGSSAAPSQMNLAGANLMIGGGVSTGNVNGGTVSLSSSQAGASGSTQNGRFTMATFAPGKATMFTSVQFNGATIQAGASPTGSTGSCAASSFSGGSLAGKFSVVACAGGTITLSALPAATNGYVCTAQDQTTSSGALKQQSNTTTSVTFAATTAASDVIVFSCNGF